MTQTRTFIESVYNLEAAMKHWDESVGSYISAIGQFLSLATEVSAKNIPADAFNEIKASLGDNLVYLIDMCETLAAFNLGYKSDGEIA